MDLYFIGIVIKDEPGSIITSIKSKFKEDYNSGAALRSPPHITLHMPFKMLPPKVELVKKYLNKAMAAINSFTVKLNAFGAFPPRVIYINVEENEQLEQLHKLVSTVMKEFGILNQNFKDKPFHPHVTVAFRDLRNADFRKAWEIYKEKDFRGEFTCNSLSLLKHNGKFWEVNSEISFAD